MVSKSHLSVPHFPISVAPGQRVVFFLTNHRPERLPDVEGQMGIVITGRGPMIVHTIKDGQISTYREQTSDTEPLEEFRIIDVAARAGRPTE